MKDGGNPMSQEVTVSVVIYAAQEEVWAGLTDPNLVRQYYFGTEVDSTWKKGSPIVFRGEWQGKKYEDKGTILSVVPGRHVSFSHWSSMSGTADTPENYKAVTYDLSKSQPGTQVTVTQECDDQCREASEKHWKTILQGLKKLLES
jgi:uncharacterized protein YndB with AHSA1/START domain